jgi:signal transduction histidine kinase/CheY-like chemotaxis protein/HPt (histidine-containing phosphotransfer) domain-containing protein
MMKQNAALFPDRKDKAPAARGPGKGRNFTPEAEYLRLTLKNSPNNFMFLNKDGVIDFGSEQMTRAIGISGPGAIHGKHFSEVYKLFENESFIQGAERTFSNIRASGKPVEEELEIHFPGAKTSRAYAVQSIPLMTEDGSFEGAKVMFFDCANSIASTVNRQVQAILDSAPFMTSIWDDEGHILECNREAFRLLGLSQKNKYIEHFYELQPKFQPDGERTADKVERLVRAAFKTGYQRFEWTFRTIAGKPLPVETTLVRVPWQSDFRVASYSRDLRELKAKEAEAREADRRRTELELESRAALMASEAKSSFLASMSHEIRTPMNAIIGMSDLMRTDNLDDQQKTYLQDIQKTSHSLLQIINEILDLSKIEAGKMELIPANYNIRALFENICALTHVTMKNKPLQFSHSLAGDVPEVLFGDEVRVRQIVLNILNNAVKYTAEGHVELRMTRALWKSRECLSIVVQDTGGGIKKEDLPRLFDKFVQFDAHKHRKVAGTGLGLPITKQLVDMMEGDILVDSEYGKGTTFKIYLPLVEGDPVSVAREHAFRYVMTGPNTKVLVVDDNVINLTVALGYLEKHGINADTAQSGAEAIDMVKAKPYDLVLMDHMMPEMDGIEATERIRALPDKRCSKVPIVALSANAVAGMEQTFLKAGMNDFLSKPIDPLKLNKVLTDWLPPENLFLSDPERPEENSGAPGTKTGKKSEAHKKRNAVPDPDADYPDAQSPEEAYQKILLSFSRNHGTDAEVIASMLEAGDVQGARRFAHSLKNIAALIGADQLSAAASELETVLSEDAGEVFWSRPLETLRAEISLALGETARVVS